MSNPILICVNINREAAVRAGKREFGEITVPLPDGLTEAQRETLLTTPFLQYGSREPGAYRLTGRVSSRELFGPEYSTSEGHRLSLPAIPDASLESISLLLDAWPAACETKRRELRDDANRRAREAAEDGSYLSDLDQKLADPDLVARRNEVAERKNAETNAERSRQYEELDRERARKRAKAKREDEERAAWVNEFGSRRLKRLLAENIEHMAVYRDERLALDMPGWAWLTDEVELDDPRNPPTEALDLLDRARATGTPDAKLHYYTIAREPGDYPDEREDDKAERGYVVAAKFLGRDIVFGERFVVETPNL
jgi:hypothetical protein